MKIVVLEGNDVVKARARYYQIISAVKERGWEVVHIKANKNLAEQLVSNSLFAENILYVVEDSKVLSQEDLNWLKNNFEKFEGRLLIYCEEKITTKTKESLPKITKFETFELPVIIWQFLDSFYPGNSKRCFSLFEKLIENSPIELVVAMLGRHLRDLYWILKDADSMNMRAWRKNKLKSQAKRFTKQQLKDTINNLAEIDYKGKISDFNVRLGVEMMILESLA